MTKMKNKNSINKIVKYIGNIVMILAVIMIARKISSYDVDYSIIFCRENISFFILITLIYSVTVIFGGIPWRNVVKGLLGCELKYSEVALVYTKSNIFKYIPGNVFQYVGRNELAVKKDLKHSDVALSTLIDAFWNIFSMMLVAVLLAWGKMYAWIKEQGGISKSSLLFLGAVIIAVVIVLVIVYRKKKQMLCDIISKVFNWKFIGVLAGNFLFYMIQGLINAGLYVGTFALLSGNKYSLEDAFTCMGVMLIAFVAGFITPGAPGGVGIREAVSLFLLGGMVPESVILSGIIIMRILSVIGDLLSVAIVWLMSRMRRQNLGD